ncbi:hypothetical protein SH1V18_25460 [Vallitalea longa]|uniref:Uncharacterized protein n=1 Tax=Vallitalea longa TaxID=2936439 RepID=A0A9W5YCC9_9FIRM|nr:hypothetical protein [Vallitalea longa]GKX30066.1 hypothetical protein SH1V18_25460 [Vallitalea longa]
MNRKKLPITRPPIIGYVVHAFPLSIIFNHAKCMPWFFCNYIQLVCNTQLETNFFDFFTICTAITGMPWVDSVYPGIPWLNRNSISSQTFIDCNLNKDQIITNSLIQNNYIVCHLDEFYVPKRYSYQKEHYPHENLIFGFDNIKKEYDILGFDFRGIFCSSKISYSEFEQASKEHDIKFLHMKAKDGFLYELDLKSIKNLLIEYLYGKNSNYRYTAIRNPNINLVYGMDIYNQLITYLRLLYNNLVVIDIRPFHILWEHKKCMVLRIQFLLDKYKKAAIGLEEIYIQYLDVQKMCYSIRTILLKYKLTKRKENLTTIISLLKDIQIKEQKIIPVLIAKIELIEKKLRK